jgi:hypothetical protein
MQNEYEMIPVYNFKDNNIIIKKNKCSNYITSFYKNEINKKKLHY